MFALSAVVSLCLLHGGSEPAAAEMEEARRWVAAKFSESQETEVRLPSIEVAANHGPVQPDARGDAPMNIAGREFNRGLYCHAESRLTVRLDRPARSLHACVGVDSNEQTRPGQGSVVFVVRANGKEIWRSEVLREGMPAVPVDVTLGGVQEFTLEVSPADDGISCDQADWADAYVVLEAAAGGSEEKVWLGDLYIDDPRHCAHSPEPPFSFQYGDQMSRDFLSSWPRSRASRKLDDRRMEHSLVCTDPATGLQVRCVCIEYHGFPTVEWTLHFKNTGAADTPILSAIQAADIRLSRDVTGEFQVHSIKGDMCTPDSYQPFVETLPPGRNLPIANTGGRPTQAAFPCFNIEWPGEGIIFALSWAGQWSVRFARDDATGLAVLGGQELTHFLLHPGEEVRSPLIVLQFYKGPWLRAQNIWRRWMRAHNMPFPNGKPHAPMLSLCTGNFYPALMTEATQEMAFLKRHVEEGIDFDVWWQDAGWYPCDGPGWPKTGTWEVDPIRFPQGLRPLSDYIHSLGKKAMVWFEPERVHADTWLTQNHPEWIHGGAGGGLLKLGDPACREWLTDHIDRLLTEQGIDYYRQDFNMDPLPYWRAEDSEDRQGITEIRHVEGYFAYWDELLRRHPGMLIDSCASGGRRNDLETLRRAVPLLRSDWYHGEAGQQCMTYGLAMWFPYFGTGFIYDKDTYWIRSSTAPEMSFGPQSDGLDHVDFERLRQCFADWHRISPYLLGDFYPLTQWSLGEDQWMAWQFHKPDLRGGVAQVFRRRESIYESARLRLQGLEPDKKYRVEDLDGKRPRRLSGEEMMRSGLVLKVPEAPSALILVYQEED